MLKLPVHNIEGKKTDEVELNPGVFEVELNKPVTHQVVKARLAAQRAGTASTKTRAEVSGGGKKPWKQKGTGRARAGSIRSPIWRGGGTVFGPRPRGYSLKISKKVKALALKSALSAKAKDAELTVVDGLDFKTPKTKEAVRIFKNLNLEGKILVVVDSHNKNAERSFRNIPGVKFLSVDKMDSYDVLDNNHIVIEQKALKTLMVRLNI